jgi:hypothetical protein
MPDESTDTSKRLGHEPIAVSVKAISIALASLFAVIIVSLLAMSTLMAYFAVTPGKEPTVGSAGRPIVTPPGVPELVADQVGDLRRLRVREDTMLTEYAWIDRQAGLVRIPIRRAMEILSAELPSPAEPQRGERK